MDLTCCERITDNSIIYLVEECTTLTLHLGGCVLLTDASIMAIAVCCGNSLRLLDCSDNGNYTDIAVLKLVACCCALKPSAFGKSSFYLKGGGFDDGGIASDIRDSISSAGHYVTTGRLTTLIMSYCTGVSRDAINYISMTYTKLDFQAAISRNSARDRQYSEDIIEEYC